MMLDRLYNRFDELSMHHGVFKVCVLKTCDNIVHTYHVSTNWQENSHIRLTVSYRLKRLAMLGWE